MPEASTPRKRKPPLANSLLQSGISHMRVALEFFNRPTQPHRYEIAAELALAAWEKVLKAYLYKARPRFKIFLPDGRTKGLNECRDEVRRRLTGSAESFLATHANLGITYTYRNQSVHLYGQGMDAILLGLFAECVRNFAQFVRQHFHRELLSPEDLGVLPVGFSRPVVPEDFLSNQSASAIAPIEVRNFLKALSDAGEELHAQGLTPEHSILVTYFVHLEDSRRASNADLVVRVNNAEPGAATLSVHRHITLPEQVRITNNRNAPEVQLGDDHLWQHFNLRTCDVQEFVKERWPHIKQNQQFWDLLTRLGNDPNVLRMSYLDPVRKTGKGKKLYSDVIYQLLITEFGEPVSCEASLAPD